MGRRPAASAVVELFAALIEARTWRQPDLARRLGVSVETVRHRLGELQRAGIPIERDEDPPNVFWSVRKGWLPGGVALTGDEVNVAVRLLARVGVSAERDRIFTRLLQLSPTVAAPVPNKAVQEGGSVLSIVEDALAQRVSLHFEYWSASRQERALRHVSVHHVEYAPHPQFLGVCHRNGALKRFRVDYASAARLDPSEPYRAAPEGSVETVLAQTVGGFSGNAPVEEHAFVVRAPDAIWVQRSLPTGRLSIEHLQGGAIRVCATTGAIDVIARFVVGLGDGARAETAALRERVRELAEGALRGVVEVNEGAATPKRGGSTGRQVGVHAGEKGVKKDGRSGRRR